MAARRAEVFDAGNGNRAGSASGVGPDGSKGYVYFASDAIGMTFALYLRGLS